MEVLGIEDRQGQHGKDVVDHRQGGDEHLQAHRRAPSQECEDAKREGDAGGCGRRPPRGGRPTVHGEVDRRRRQHPADGAQNRQHRRPPVGEGADGHLAADLQADEEKEQGQQALGDPVADAQRQGARGQTDPESGVDQAAIGRRQDRVGAHQSRGGGHDQHQAGRGRQAGEGPRRALHLRRQRPLQRLEHGIEIPGPVVALAVDEDGRGPGHAIATAISEIFVDMGLDIGVGEIAFEAVHVEADRAGGIEHVLARKRRLASIERVVHVEEAALPCGRFRRLGGELRPGVGVLVGEVAEDVGQALAQRLAQAGEHAAKAPAVGAQVVAVDQYANPIVGFAVPAHVIALEVDRTPQSELDAAGQFRARSGVMMVWPLASSSPMWAEKSDRASLIWRAPRRYPWVLRFAALPPISRRDAV